MKNETTEDRGAVKAARSKPINIDVMEPDYERFLGDQGVDIMALAEEIDPADPGEMSGANLILSGIREDTAIHAGFAYHPLGLLSGAALLRFIAEALTIIEQGPAGRVRCIAKLAAFQPTINGRLSDFYLAVCGEAEPRLSIAGAGHCFGVVGAERLQRFLRAALMRAIFGKSAPPEHLTIAAQVIQACLARTSQDLGQVQRF